MNRLSLVRDRFFSTAIVLITSCALFSQQPAGQFGSGHVTLDLWPHGAPGAKPIAEAEADITKPGVKLVDAGSATTSYLLWKISEAPAGEFIVGSMMPFSGGFLSVAEVAAIRTWVTEGALDN